MRFDELNENNYLLFAIKFYDNPQSVTKEDFDDDLKRIKYVKRLLQKIHKHKTLKSIRERLIINHIIILRNVFGEQNTCRILFFKTEVLVAGSTITNDANADDTRYPDT